MMFETLKTFRVCKKSCTKMIWNYVETAGFVSLHVSLQAVFRNSVALVITSGKTKWGY